MKDGSHNLSEFIVIVADYYLIKSLDETFIPKYFDWIKKGRDEELNEAKFLSIFNFDESLKTELKNLINNILNSRNE